MTRVVLISLLLAGCVAAQSSGTAVGARDIVIGGVKMNVRQVNGGTVYGMVADASGNYSDAPVGTGDAVLVRGAPDRNAAIRAMGVFCSFDVNPADWDTDQVPVLPGSGEYQFGACL